MRLLHSVLLALISFGAAFGQSYTISTVAGGGLPINIPGTSARLYGPQDLTIDKTGNVFFVDGNTVLRLDAATGVLTLMAGNGTPGFSGDNGPAANSQLRGPHGIAVDTNGSLYVADTGNNRIRRVSNGVITTISGTGVSGSLGDGGLATSAQLFNPWGITLDAAGSIYVTEWVGYRIRKIANGVISTIAGTGVGGFGGDNGPATGAQLDRPKGIAFDTSGTLYVADFGNHRVRKIAGGVISTVAGNGTAGFSGDGGTATNAQLYAPTAVSVDASGNLYVADRFNGRVRKIANGVITALRRNSYGVCAK